MHHGMSPIKPSIPTYTSRTSARYSGNGQLLITRPWTRTLPSHGTTSAPAKQKALKTKMDI